MLTTRPAILLILVATAIAGPPPAHAERALLVVGGGAAEHERAIVGGAVERAIRNAGWSLPAKPLTRREADGLLDCPDSGAPWRCVPGSSGAGGVRGAFAITVERAQADDGTPLIVITGKMIVTNPPSFTVRQRFCEHCADDKLGEAGEELTQQLVDELAARSGRTVVRITSVPPGAEIILDSVRIGATDATFNTFPATHVAIVQKPGFLSEAREFTVEEGKTAELAFTLRASRTPSPRDRDPGVPRPPPSRLVPGIAIGAGAGLAVFGGISLYLGLRDGSGGKFDYTRATLVGVTSGLVGLGAIGAGSYCLWRDSERSAPTAGITPGGAVVGWAGRF